MLWTVTWNFRYSSYPELPGDQHAGAGRMELSEPIGTCGNVAQAGAVLAVAIKAASNKTKQVGYPACLSALLGITEPAVFGVNLKFVKPFIMSMIGGGVGGFLASIFHLRATGMSITGIPGTLLYLNEQLPLYILVNVISFAVAFALTWFFGFNKKMEQ